jgi:hypothetical protein
MIKQDWCLNYINRQTARLKGIFAWGTEEEIIPGSIYHALLAVKGIKKGTKEVRDG